MARAVSRAVSATGAMAVRPVSVRTCIVVLGMHRSGTSALSRVLSLLGCDLPKTLMPANAANEPGYWESMAMYKLNDRILDSAGSAWHDWQELNPRWSQSLKAAQFAEEAGTVLAEEFGSSRLFVLKDPRICRLFPFWRDVLEENGVRPLVWIPLRNPLEVAASLEKRDGLEPSLGHLLWLRNLLDSEVTSRGTPRIISTYDQLMRGWSKLAERAEKVLGVVWPRFSDRAAGEIDAFLSDTHRHHMDRPEDVLDNPTLSAWVRNSFDILTRWANSGEDSRDYSTLDRIRAEFSAAAPAFARLVDQGRAAGVKVRSLEKALESNAVALEATNAASIAAVAELRGENESLAQANASAEQRIANLRTELKAQATATAEAEQLAASLRDRLSETQSALAQRSLEAEQTAEELRSTATAKDESERIAAGLKDQLGSLRSELDQLKAEGIQQAEEWKRAEKEKDEEIAHLRSELDQSKAVAEAARETLGSGIRNAREEQAKLEKRLDERISEIASLTRMLSDAELNARQKDQSLKATRTAVAQDMRKTIAALLDAHAWKIVPGRIRIRRQMALLRKAGLFDADWYLKTNPDVAEAGADPLRHYVAHGFAEERCPNKLLSECQGAKLN